MPDSVIKTKVDDSEFWKYVEATEKHKETLEDLAGGWGKVSASAKATIKVYTTGTALLLAQNEIFHKETMELMKQQGAVKNLAEAEKKRAAALQDAWQSTKRIAASIVDMTKNLLKWSGIGSIVSGLAGIGGLFGIAGLAERVTDTRRTAIGFGTRTGPMQAFGVNYGRYFDTQSVLSNVAATRSDYAKLGIYSMMGIDPRGKQDTADLSIQVARRARDIFKNSDQSMQFAQAHGLLNIFSMEDLRNLASMTDLDLKIAEQNYEKDKKNLQVSDDQQRAWVNLEATLKRAELTIFTVLVDKLAPLAPQIAALSGTVIDTIRNFTNTKAFHNIIDELAKGMKALNQWVSSDNFQKDIKTFADTIGQVADGLVRFLKMIGWIKATPLEKWQAEDPMARKREALQHMPHTWKSLVPFGPDDQRAEAIAKMDVPPWLQGLQNNPAAQAAAAAANPDAGNVGGAAGFGLGAPAGANVGGAPTAGQAPGTGTAGLGSFGGGNVPLEFTRNRVKGNPALAGPMINRLMKEGGWTRTQATAIVASLYRESAGLSPNPEGSNDKNTAFGLAQWHQDRRDDFNKWAAERHLADIYHSNIWEQADFVNYELTQGKRSLAGKHLRNQTDLGQASDIVVKEYEGPADTIGAQRDRRQLAVTISLQVSGGAPGANPHTKVGAIQAGTK